MVIGFFFIQERAFYYTVFQDDTEGFSGADQDRTPDEKRIGGRGDKIYPTENDRKKLTGVRSAFAIQCLRARGAVWKSDPFGALHSRRPKMENARLSSRHYNGRNIKSINNYGILYRFWPFGPKPVTYVFVQNADKWGVFEITARGHFSPAIALGRDSCSIDIPHGNL